VRLYEEDPDLARALAPDRRTFLYETSRGEVRAVTGYRGSNKPLSRRGLPACDAKMLVNVVFEPTLGALLDPFAGAGGIVAEAIAGGWKAVSCDVDPALRHGLLAMGAEHHVCDARALPFDAESVDAVATEPPYADEAAGILPAALDEMHRVLKPGGRLAMLCAAWQAEALRHRASALGLRSYLDAGINRKGLDVVVLAWEK
jgi:tRNA G10  N-methylase Trm11